MYKYIPVNIHYGCCQVWNISHGFRKLLVMWLIFIHKMAPEVHSVFCNVSRHSIWSSIEVKFRDDVRLFLILTATDNHQTISYIYMYEGKMCLA